MEHGVLSGSPLSMGIGHRGVSGQDTGDVPPEQVWVVQKCSGVELMVVHHDGSLVSQASSESLGDEHYEPPISEPASDIEILNGELSDHEHSEHASNLGSGGIVGPVPVGLLRGSHENIVCSTLWEPRLKNINIMLGLWSPAREPFLHIVG